MIAVAVLLLFEHGSDPWRQPSFAVRIHSSLKPFGPFLVAGLAIFFIIYSVALVRLNLGLPIPT